MIKVVVGLGNPGSQYAASRHNVGFRVVDRVAAARDWHWDGKRDRAVLAQGQLQNTKVVLVKPQTYMNESGVAVGPICRFFKIDPRVDLLVICDDLDLPVGRIRVRAKGSAGGQHGLESVIAHLGNADFARLRVGIGKPTQPPAETIGHGLGSPHGHEAIDLASGEDRAATAVLAWIATSTAEVMNTFNAQTLPTKTLADARPPRTRQADSGKNEQSDAAGD